MQPLRMFAGDAEGEKATGTSMSLASVWSGIERFRYESHDKQKFNFLSVDGLGLILLVKSEHLC